MLALQRFSYWASRFTSPQNAFIALGAIFGLTFLVLTPPFMVNDEPTHMYRAYQLSNFDFHNDPKHVGSYFPVSLVDLLQAGANKPFEVAGHPTLKQFISHHAPQPLNAGQRVWQGGYTNTAIYSPVVYAPHIVGIWVGRILNLSPIWIFYIARLCGLVAWLSLTWYAIKIAPVGKWLLLVFALLPSSLYEGIALSADSVTTGLAFALVAKYLQVAYARKLSRADVIILGILAIAISLAKPSYIFLIWLIALLPPVVWRDRPKHALKGLIFFGGIALFSAAAWGLHVHQIVPLQGIEKAATNPSEQVGYVLTHPLAYLIQLFNSLLSSYSNTAVYQLLGAFGWGSVFLPAWLYVVEISLITIVAVQTLGDRPLIIPRLQRWGLILLTVLQVLAVSVSLYAIWERSRGELFTAPFGMPIISGRYLIPLLPLALLFLPSGRPSVVLRARTIIMLVGFVLACSGFALANAYFGLPHKIVAHLFQLFGPH